MNSMQNNPPDDKSLDMELEELDHAYQRLEPDEPPDLLDQAILNTAHRAVEGKDFWMDFGWIHGLTTAAVIVLTISIIMMQRQPVPLEEDGLFQTGTELKQERTQELRKNTMQKAPTDRETDSLAGSRKDSPPEPVAAREARSKKAETLGDIAMEEEMVPSSAPAKDMPVRAPAATPGVEFADDKMDSAELKEDQLLKQTEEERLLQAILVLKQAGDKRWKTELESFRELYPDYPLPDELTE